MSFFRAEAMARVTRWAETAVYGALTLTLLGWLWSGPMNVTRGAVLLLVAAVGFWLTRAALLSALAGRIAAAPGVVSIDERRIAYFAPHGGGIASINAVTAIGITRQDGAVAWALTHEDTPLIIPIAAEGAGGLIDAFAALPGFQPTTAITALNVGQARLVWHRPGTAPPSALRKAMARSK